MCWCRPEIRTPRCNRLGCVPPKDKVSSKEAELNQCPFCGGEARIEEGNRETKYIAGQNILQEPTHDFVACQTSECAVSFYRARVNGEPGFENLKQRWNRRSDTDPRKLIADLAAENARLEAALKFYARKSNWASASVFMCGHSGQTQADCDGGDKARAALAKVLA